MLWFRKAGGRAPSVFARATARADPERARADGSSTRPMNMTVGSVLSTAGRSLYAHAMSKRFSRIVPILFAGIVFLGCGGSGDDCETYNPGSVVECERPADCPPCGPICAADGFDTASGPACVESPGFGMFCDCTCQICY